jgi:hypothetical protein
MLFLLFPQNRKKDHERKKLRTNTLKKRGKRKRKKKKKKKREKKMKKMKKKRRRRTILFLSILPFLHFSPFPHPADQ